MSWSLRLRHGDLALDGNQLETVTAEQKLIQDLRCAILERMGNDPIHPEHGSLIDGGQRLDGTEAESIIGRSDWDYVRLEIEADLRRIFAAHQAKQLLRAKADSNTYNKATMTAGEVLITIQNMEIWRSLDSVFVRVTVQTAANNMLQLNIPFAL